MPIVGQVTPDFPCEAYYNDTFVQRNLIVPGIWNILVFYPADFSFVCPTELQELATLYDDFLSLKAELVSLSTDSIYVHKAWHDSSNAISTVRFPMVADPGGRISKSYGVYNEELGQSQRGTFLIDPDRIIRAFEVSDNSIGRSGQELLRKLRAGIYVRENPGMVCSASWKQGEGGIKSGIDMVGKI